MAILFENNASSQFPFLILIMYEYQLHVTNLPVMVQRLESIYLATDT